MNVAGRNTLQYLTACTIRAPDFPGHREVARSCAARALAPLGIKMFQKLVAKLFKIHRIDSDIDMIDLSSLGWVQVVSLWWWVAGRSVRIREDLLRGQCENPELTGPCRRFACTELRNPIPSCGSPWASLSQLYLMTFLFFPCPPLPRRVPRNVSRGQVRPETGQKPK